MRRLREFWTPLRLLDAAIVLAVIYVTIWSLHPQLLVSSSLITGGDTGSHLAMPAYLRTTGNVFDFTPWYPGWLAGIPAYSYYFVLPDVLATLASYVIGFAVAIKLATIVGSVLMPITAYAMARLFRAPRPIPAALAIATLPFLFDASFTIDGGNLFSTMAGEYSFSLSLALALLTIGLVARGVRTGRGYWVAALGLSLTLASHVLPWLFSLGAIAVLVVFELLHRRGIGEPIEQPRVPGGDSRPNRFAVAVGLAVLAFLPFFFDTNFSINSTGAFSTRQGVYSLLLTLALALLTIGRFMQGAPRRRDYWLLALDFAALVASCFMIVRFSFAAVLGLVALELFQRRATPGARADATHRPADVKGDVARPVRFAVLACLLSFALSAWWLLPFATTQSLTDSLGYTNEGVNTVRGIFSLLGWYNATGGAAGDRWVIVLCAVAIVVAFAARDRLGMVLGALTVLSFWAFALDPQSAIWDQRLMPFWYISIHLAAGWLVGYIAWRWAFRLPARYRWAAYFAEIAAQPADAVEGDRAEPEPEREPEPVSAHESVDAARSLEADDPRYFSRRLVQATCAVALLGLLSTVPGLIKPLANVLHLSTGGNQVSVWAETNYSGYQAQSGWPEYHNLMETMGDVAKRYGCGRAMWEYSASEQRFGTPEALMLLPYWTNNCVGSMEGLLMESSPTTPYHYLDQSELSAAPSDPQVGLSYGPVDVSLGVGHLQMLGVKYFVAFSPEILAEARSDPDLQLITKTRDWPAPGVQWWIFLVRDSPIVQALSYTPNVVAGIASQYQWLEQNETWWLNPDLQHVYAAMSGPASWPRASIITKMTKSAPLPSVVVSHVRVGLQSIAFHVSRVGVPMLVKISYYPRWHATGASGPYRVSPNLMVVVPTAKDVSLAYGSTPAITLGSVVSDVTVIAGLALFVVVLKRRRNLRR